MLTPLIIFFIVYIFIATELIDKTIAALIGAGIMIILHLVSYEEALHAVDLNVVFLLVGMMIIVNILSDTGAFEWIAIKIARAVNGNALLITISFMLLTSVLSAFLDNVTTVILIAPITILLTQLLEIPAMPILIMEAIFSNIGGTATLIGDPPNIIIGSQTRLTFNDFLINLSVPVIIMLLVSTIVMVFILKKSLVTKDKLRERIERSRPEKAILNPKTLKKSLIVFSFVLLGFFCGRILNIEPGIIALSGSMVMILVCKENIHKSLINVEWNTILFFCGLFMMVATLEHKHVFEKVGEHILHMCNGNLMVTTLTILWFSAIASAIVDNIPLVMAMLPLIKNIIPVFALQLYPNNPMLVHSKIEEPLFWALALGACLGGNGTLVGASANVVVSQIGKKNNCNISFWNFTRFGFPFMLLTLVIAHAYLWIRFFR